VATLSVTVNAAGVQVMPGQAASFTVDVRNLGTVVERYRCDIIGIDPAWVTVAPMSIELFPQREPEGHDRADAPPTSGRFTVTVHPPRSSAATAGQWPIAAHVSSEHDPTAQIAEEAAITILPFGEIAADLRPAVLAARFRAGARLHVTKNGNRPETVTILGARGLSVAAKEASGMFPSTS
jgi:uncharacterized membrane protein